MLRLVDILIQLPSNKISIVFRRKGQSGCEVSFAGCTCELLEGADAFSVNADYLILLTEIGGPQPHLPFPLPLVLI